jgi:hypothetical protein
MSEEMKKEFIPYELALRMKQLGFDEPCLAYWDNDKLFIIDRNSERIQKNSNYKDIFEGIISAPLYQQAFRWFRKEHNLKFHIKEDVWNNWCSLKMIRHDDYISIGEYKTYEEAELECLKKLIEIVESKS